ncbi:hypothetical protein KBD45_06015 [Candidatus Dojkabacteria bacterium]|nr:hypothetical protein [Candidatus Dojkabacteria bacterium]
MNLLGQEKTKNNNCMYTLEFYSPDVEFDENLRFKCLLYFFDNKGNRRNIFGNFIGFFTKFKLSSKFATFSFLLLFLGGGIYFVNLNNTALSNDFVLTQVYAQNTQTNLMPFMMLSSSYDSRGDNPGLLNPATIPLANDVKSYNYGHIGYELRKGESLSKCREIYPFPDDITKVEAYEYLNGKGEIMYKIFGIGQDGKWQKYVVLEDGQLVKIGSDGKLAKASMNNSIKMKVSIGDIIGKLPKTISIEKKNGNYLLLSWQKQVLCNNIVENLIINVLIDSTDYKIKNLSTFLNSSNAKNLLYSMEFVSSTSTFQYDDIKSNFELDSKEEELFLM